ncbi:FAD-dependent oxidoreductase [Serratia marcescens]|uniref:FAD-dependent oxidoreductase n=1 Tax=Serratia marcescens TaxID=615 RepID=UPI0037046ED8
MSQSIFSSHIRLPGRPHAFMTHWASPPTGIVLKTDERHETSMPGIYAAGDLANAGIPSVTTATWQGAMAGIFAQQSMLT